MGYDEQVIRDCEANEDARQIWQDNYDEAYSEYLSEVENCADDVFESDRLTDDGVLLNIIEDILKLKSNPEEVNEACTRIGHALMKHIISIAQTLADKQAAEYADECGEN